MSELQQKKNNNIKGYTTQAKLRVVFQQPLMTYLFRIGRQTTLKIKKLKKIKFIDKAKQGVFTWIFKGAPLTCFLFKDISVC